MTKLSTDRCLNPFMEISPQTSLQGDVSSACIKLSESFHDLASLCGSCATDAPDQEFYRNRSQIQFAFPKAQDCCQGFRVFKKGTRKRAVPVSPQLLQLKTLGGKTMDGRGF